MDEVFNLYLRVREKEGRLYSDEIVKQLPAISSEHPLRSEWRCRAASSLRLVLYLGRFSKRTSLLEIGCGNGWLANRVAESFAATVVGLDREGPELVQAGRVFGHRQNLSWVAADIFRPPFGRCFDVVVMASSIQYFPDLSQLIEALLPMMRRNGEIHIFDSPLYSEHDLPAARERSRRYYEQLGFPRMAAHYHHHTSAALDPYHPVWLYRPNPSVKDSPFPWIRLRV